MRTISLDEEAYKRLAARKHEEESFSDVIKRLTDERSWTEVAGIWEDDAKEIETAIGESRERSRQRSERFADEFGVESTE